MWNVNGEKILLINLVTVWFSWQFNFVADISNEILKDSRCRHMCFQFNTFRWGMFRVWIRCKKCDSEQNSYLVSPTATTKTEPVAPFPFREIHAVFLRVHRSFLPDAGEPSGVAKCVAVRYFMFLLRRKKIRYTTILSLLLSSLFAFASIAPQIN